MIYLALSIELFNEATESPPTQISIQAVGDSLFGLDPT